jgi:hypothetical protein
MVVWQSDGQDGDGETVMARAYRANGSPWAGELVVNTFTAGDQQKPDVAAAGADGFVVVWESWAQASSGWDVIGRRFGPAGGAIGGEFVVNSYLTSNQQGPAVGRASGGAFLVAWQGANHQDGDGWGVFAQRYKPDGTRHGGEFGVNAHTSRDQDNPAVGMNAAGSVMVVWESVEQDFSSDGVFGRAVNAKLEFSSDEFQANAYIVDAQHSPDVAWSDAGNYVITWASFDQERASDEVYAVVNTQLIVSPVLFADGFESGDTSEWAGEVP